MARQMFKVASARIHQDLYEKFDQKCVEDGLTVHMKIKNFIEEELNDKTGDNGSLQRSDEGIQTPKGSQNPSGDDDVQGLWSWV